MHSSVMEYAYVFFMTILLFKRDSLAYNYQQPRFLQNGLHLMTGDDLAQYHQLPLTDCSRVLGFGDANSDSFADLFTLSADKKRINVHLWRTKEFKFDWNASWSLDMPLAPTNIYLSDFNYDGWLDMVVLFGADKQEAGKMTFYAGSNREPWDAKPVDIAPAWLGPQPALMSITGDMRSELFGIPFNSNSSDKKRDLSIWRFNPSTKQFDVSAYLPLAKACVPAQPHSNTLVDMNGDCISDLFLQCAPESSGGTAQAQLWIHPPSDQSEAWVMKSFDLPSKIGQVTFADVNADGTMDAIFFTCESASSCYLNVALNRQKPICTRNQHEGCLDSKSLCTADPDFSISFTKPQFRVSLSDLTGKSVLSAEEIQSEPVHIQTGDINQDGYPDLLITVSSRQKNPTDASLILLENIPCSAFSTAGKESLCTDRGFHIWKEGTSNLMGITGVQQAAFFTMDHRGALDILVKRSNDKVDLLYNNFYNDAFFLKIMATNGACSKFCANELGNKPWGVNYPGATFKYTVLDVNGHKRSAISAHSMQSAYQRLDTPYVLMGLGRTNNYLEEFYVGVTRKQSVAVRSWNGIIPNSQLVVHPFQTTNTDPSTWVMELHINPSEYAIGVLITLVIGLIVLAAVVWGLKIMENREDEREKRKKLHVINFDAL